MLIKCYFSWVHSLKRQNIYVSFPVFFLFHSHYQCVVLCYFAFSRIFRAFLSDSSQLYKSTKCRVCVCMCSCVHVYVCKFVKRSEVNWVYIEFLELALLDVYLWWAHTKTERIFPGSNAKQVDFNAPILNLIHLYRTDWYPKWSMNRQSWTKRSNCSESIKL